MSNLELKIDTLKEAYLQKNLTKSIEIDKKPKFLLDLLMSINPKTDHSKDKFIYIGYCAEYLPLFADSKSFWLSPQKIMDLEEYGSCSSRNKEILELWIFLFGWNKEIQVSHTPGGSGWCSVM